MAKYGKDYYRGQVAAVQHHFYITGAIGEADEYIDLIDCLYSGKQGDSVVIHLNTPGGHLDTTMQIINAIRASECEVIGLADGPVCSAGTLILFACPNIGVQDFSYLMLHDGSEGVMGKINENLKQAQFTAKLLEKICLDVYQPFFTKKEIQSILDGKDMWLTSEEVNLRIVKAVKEENEKEPIQK